MSTPPFDRRLSLTLDAIVIALEAATDETRRAWLRWMKRMTELRAMPKGGAR
jgi:hypothetical protein